MDMPPINTLTKVSDSSCFEQSTDRDTEHHVSGGDSPVTIGRSTPGSAAFQEEQSP